MNKTLIIGAHGMIGRKLQAQMRYRGDSFVCFPKLDLLQVNGLDLVKDLVMREKVTHVVNLAWTSNRHSNYDQSLDNFAWKDFCIKLQQILSKQCHLIFFGTGLDDKNTTLPYIEAKRTLKIKFRSLIESEEISWLRPFYVYDFSLFRPRILKEMKDVAPNSLYIKFGDAKQDYISSVDVAAAIIAVISKNLRGSIDIGTGQQISNIDFAFKAANVLGLPVPVNLFLNCPDGPIANTFKLNSAGWTPYDSQKVLFS
jgi:nucleoside-diphosphate-sugar epimerase